MLWTRHKARRKGHHLMKIMQPSFEILTPFSEGGVKELQLIEKAARTCYKSEDKITEDGESARKFIKMLLDRGHEAPIEFSFAAVKIICDRAVANEIVRHRLFSYAQESTRYCNYSKDGFGSEIAVIRPSMLEDGTAAYGAWESSCEQAEKSYLMMLGAGESPQIARDVLPMSLKTEINVGGNYREWRHFFKLRCDKGAHPQLREIAIPLLKAFQEGVPIVFDDLNFDER